MQRSIIALGLVAAFALPCVAAAQSGPDQMGPPPEMRAKLESLRTQAKSDAYAALSTDHRARVTAIVARIGAGGLGPREASQQIDALLSKDEATSVVAVAQKSRAQMRASFSGMPGRGGPPPEGPPPDGAPAGGPPSGAGPGGDERRAPSAGRFLVMISMAPGMGPRPPRPAASP